MGLMTTMQNGWRKFYAMGIIKDSREGKITAMMAVYGRICEVGRAR